MNDGSNLQMSAQFADVIWNKVTRVRREILEGILSSVRRFESLQSNDKVPAVLSSSFRTDVSFGRVEYARQSYVSEIADGLLVEMLLVGPFKLDEIALSPVGVEKCSGSRCVDPDSSMFLF